MPQEPALSFIELQNEDDIFFYTSEKAFAACPTYRKLFTARFCDWLLAKYGSEAKLQQAWSGALKPGEALAAKNIEPQTNPWFFSDAHLPGPDRRRAPAFAGFGGLAARDAEQILQPVRQGHS